MLTRNAVFRFAAIAGLTCFATAALAQSSEPLTIRKINDRIYMAEGGGGASGIVIGQNGVIVIDVKTTAESGKDVVDAVKKLTPKPITTVIFTHSDGDHVNGIVSFPKGLTIVAQENDKKEMEEALAAGARGAPPKELLPNKVVTQTREDDVFDGVKMTLIHVAPAHTSGDLAIYLPDEKVVFTGDLVGNGDPTIHAAKHGQTEGWIKFVTALTQLDANTYLLGHAPPATKAQFEAKLKAASDKRAKITALVRESKSLDQIKQALGEAPAPGAAAPRFASYTEVVYDELTKR